MSSRSSSRYWIIAVSTLPWMCPLSSVINTIKDLSDSADIWITPAALNPAIDLPSLPIDYTGFVRLKKCLYVRGVPATSLASDVRDLFQQYGCVVKTPLLISLGSRNVFRWVVMATEEGATKALHGLHGCRIGPEEDDRLFVSMAIASRRLLSIAENDVRGEKNSVEAMDQEEILQSSVEAGSGANPRRYRWAHQEHEENDDGPLPLRSATMTQLRYSLPHQTRKVKRLLQPPIGTGRSARKSLNGVRSLDKLKSPKHRSVLELLIASVPDTTSSEGSDVECVSNNDDAEEASKVKSPLSSKQNVKTPPRERHPNIPLTDQETLASTQSKTLASTQSKNEDGNDQDVTKHDTDRNNIPRSSWADIASTSDPDTKVIDLQPKGRAESASERSHRHTVSLPRHTNVGDGDDPYRLVFLLNVPHTITLQDVSDAITEGPIAKIQFGFDNDGNRFVGIIFQNGWEARKFFRALLQERKTDHPTKFRFIVEAEMGGAHHPDDLIRAMGYPLWATRRLTIVKARFFFMFGEKQLRELCKKLVGEDNIQLIWLYNGGNATCVFADVLSAVRVKEYLDKKAANAGKPGGESPFWEELNTKFSRDPCVHSLTLTTTLHD